MKKLTKTECFSSNSLRNVLKALSFIIILLISSQRSQAQVYTYTVEGFDDPIFPISAATAPTVETPFVTSTGAWRLYKGYTVTGSDPCPSGGTNRAMRLSSSANAYVVSPNLPTGCAQVTWKDGRTNKTFTVYTSTDDGATWSSGTNVVSGSPSCTQILYNVMSTSVNRVKIANLQGSDMGIDSLLITPLAIVPPTVTTTVATNVTFLTATSGGNVTASGNVAVTDRGVVWSTSAAPTITTNLGITHDGTGLGAFTSSITGLTQLTTYHYRAFATNSAGTAYGTDYTFNTPANSPLLVANPTSLSFGNVVVGSVAPQQTYTLTGYYLTPAAGNITITAPAGFKVSNGGAFTSSVTIPYSGGSLAATTIFVQFGPGTPGAFSANLSNAGGGATTVNVNVNGVGQAKLPGVTNVGFDFWTGFGYEEKMSQKAYVAAEAKMSLYISVPAGTGASATVVVDIPRIPGASSLGGNVPNFPRTITVAPGTVTEVTGFPTGDSSNQYNLNNRPDVRLYYTGVTNRGVHISSTNGVPISVWMHTYANNNSAAGAMLFPTNTWQSTYTVQAYGGYSNNSNPNSFFFVIANQDSTPIWVKPSQDVVDSLTATLFNDGHTAAMVKYHAGIEYGPIYLNAGQVFNAMGYITGSGSGTTAGKAFGLDLSGSTVRTTCDKSIAVFGGNGRCLVNTSTCTSTSGSDNMVQQMFPDVAWGKKYLTAPTVTMEQNIFRIYVQDPTTQVWVNDPNHVSALPVASLINNLYYEINNKTPNLIESDKPISVTQLIIAAGNCIGGYGIKGNGDPEMIILSPMEQAINSTTVYSAPIKNPSATYNGHYINVIIKHGGVPSFRLDGGTTGDPGINQATASGATCYNTGGVLPLTSIFQPHPQDTSYYYAKLRVANLTAHTLTSDSAFNAIAYGMGDGESYGYNAGCSVKDLSQYLLLGNPYGVASGITCKNNPFYFKIAIPYAPAQLTSLQWQFFGNPYMTPNADVTQNTPLPDSTFPANGTMYYVYKLPTPYQFSQAGTYSFKVLANALTPGGCTGAKVLNNTITVVNGPTTNFNFTSASCGSTSISFTDLSTSDSTGITTWNWNFGDAATLADTSHLTNPTYVYPSLSAYTVTLRAINAIGCYSDSSRIVDLSGGLTANFTVAPSDTVCANATITFTDHSTSAGTYGSLNQWTWNFGEGAPVVATTGAAQTHTYSTVGVYTATLTVKTTLNCTSTVYSHTIVVNAVPVVNSAASGTVCSGAAQNYAITSTVAGTVFTWSRAAVAGISNAAANGQTANPITEALINTTTAPIVVTYTITPTVGSCSGSAFTYTVTVNPAPGITSAPTATVCSGVALNYTITSNTVGSTYSWSRAAMAGISNAAVSAQTSNPITEALVNTTNAPINVVYVITPSANGCAGAAFNLTVTVYPTVTITSAGSGSICNNTALNYTITSSVAGATFVWSRPTFAGISNAPVSGQTSNPITETLINTTNSPILVTYTITGTANGCAGAVFTYDLFVAPTATITSASTGTVCSGAALNYTITSGVSGATFSWSRAAVAGISNAAVSGQVSNPITETLVNTTTAPINVIYTITPTANGCAGTQFTYTVTVNPVPTVTSVATGAICSGQPLNYLVTSNVAGATFSWNRAAVAGISNAAVTGQTANPITESLINTTNNTINVDYSIVASFGGCSAAAFTYTVTVTPAPVITSAATNTICNNTPQNYSITSATTGTTYTWSRAVVAGISNAAVGGQTSNPITETLVNTSSATVTVTYIINSSANGCPGPVFNYNVTVQPTAVVTSAAIGSVCSGAALNYSITSSTTGATYTWDRAAVAGINNAAVSGQTANPIAETLVNTTNSPINVTYVITPTIGTCVGTAFNYTVTVNPTATVTSAVNDTVCSGAAQNYFMTSAVGGTTFSWSRAAVAGVINAAVSAQTSNPITEALNNTSSAPVNVTYVIVPTANGCAGTSFNHVVTVNPVAVVNSATTGSVCGGTALNYNITSNVGSATFSWSRGVAAGISNAPVSGQTANPITETLVNTTTSPVNVTYTIIATTGGCAGTPFTYTVTVNPTPAITSVPTGNVCSGQPLSYLINSTVAGTTYSWSRAYVTGITNAGVAGQTANPIAETLANTTTSAVNVVYSIVASFNGCSASAFNYTVTVNPTPLITSAASGTICNNTAQNYTITSSVAGTAFSWSRAAVAGIANAPVSGQTVNIITETLSNTGNTPVLVTYVITPTSNGCAGNPFNYTVTVQPTATVTSAAAGSVCSDVPQGYAITSNVAGATFSWTRAVVTGISNAAGSGSSATITEALTNTTSGSINVLYVITPSINGCAGTPFNYTVSVKPTATVTSAATGNICSNGPVFYQITSGVAGATFSWDRPAVTGIATAAVTGQTANPINEVLTSNANAPVIVTYIITPTANGCAGTPFNYNVTVNPIPAITSTTHDTICSGSQYNYLITSNVVGAVFTWSRPFATNISNAPVSGQTSNPIVETLVNFSTVDSADVVYQIVPSINGCTGAPIIDSVNIKPRPTVSIAPFQTSQCAMDTIQFVANVSGSVSGYHWNFGDGSSASADTVYHLYTPGGNYIVTVDVDGTKGCNASSPSVTISAMPLLAAPVITVDSSTTSIIFHWQSIMGASGYEVSFDSVTFMPPNGPDGMSYIVTGLNPTDVKGIYVRALGSFACQNSIAFAWGTAALPDIGIFVPNTISPDGDGKNDRLKVLGNDILSVRMQVYNQWGQLIYSYDGKDNPNAGWDGTVNGTAQPIGVYAYSVTVGMKNGKIFSKKGLFNLIR